MEGEEVEDAEAGGGGKRERERKDQGREEIWGGIKTKEGGGNDREGKKARRETKNHNRNHAR